MPKKIDTHDILDSIMQSTSSAFTDGYDTDKILMTQEVYDAFKESYNGNDFDRIFSYPVEIDTSIESYKVIIKEMT